MLLFSFVAAFERKFVADNKAIEQKNVKEIAAINSPNQTTTSNEFFYSTIIKLK